MSRAAAIQAELESLGYRMEPSLTMLDSEDDGAAIIDLATGEMVENEHDLPPKVIDLATEWSMLNAPTGLGPAM
ncbi:MAG: hypothetical protein HKL99_10490 [Burkholderiales bacterium]|nr:hypothetical protein [Burkholderiales bacterium]